MAKIKHHEPNTDTSKDEVHVLRTSTKTMCGEDITVNSSHWTPVSDSTKVTCAHKACSNT